MELVHADPGGYGGKVTCGLPLTEVKSSGMFTNITCLACLDAFKARRGARMQIERLVHRSEDPEADVWD